MAVVFAQKPVDIKPIRHALNCSGVGVDLDSPRLSFRSFARSSIVR